MKMNQKQECLKMLIIIEKSGLFSSFQDFGRRGYEYDGVILCGVFDILVYEIVN